MKKILFTLVSCFLFSQSANAFGTFMASGNLLERGEYDLTGNGQFFSNGQSGSNFGAIIELPFQRDTNLRFNVSTGTIALAAGAHLKWVPIKEADKGLNVGLINSVEFASEDSVELMLLRVGPFASRTFTWEMGEIEPYIGLPTGVRIIDSDNEMTSQLVLGTKVKFEQLDYMSFAVEGGFKVKNAFSHLAVFATIQLGK